MFGQTLSTEDYLVPRFQVELPATLYVNGKQIPPIKADGEVISFSVTSLKIRCDSKIPIPSKGILRLSLGGTMGKLELNVDFVQRIEVQRSIWSWKELPKYELHTTLGDNPLEMVERYQKYVHRHLFGGFF